MRQPTRPGSSRPTTHVVHPDPAHRPPPRHRAGGFFPLTDSPPASDTPSQKSSNAPIRPDATAPTHASPNEPAAANSHEKRSTTPTSDTEGHPKSRSHAYKVNGIGIRRGSIRRCAEPGYQRHRDRRARTACRSASRSGSWGDLLTSLSECREGVVCDAFGVVGVELQSVVDSDDPFGLLAWRQFGRTVQRSGLSGAVMYLTSPFDT